MSIMKIKNLIYISSIFFLAVSCDEDFLETYPTASLSQEQVGEALAVNPAAAEGTLFGIYEQFYRLGSGGYGGQECRRAGRLVFLYHFGNGFHLGQCQLGNLVGVERQ